MTSDVDGEFNEVPDAFWRDIINYSSRKLVQKQVKIALGTLGSPWFCRQNKANEQRDPLRVHAQIGIRNSSSMVSLLSSLRRPDVTGRGMDGSESGPSPAKSGSAVLQTAGGSARSSSTGSSGAGLPPSLQQRPVDTDTRSCTHKLCFPPGLGR